MVHAILLFLALPPALAAEGSAPAAEPAAGSVDPLADPHARAEYARLQSELRRLAARQAWAGVERTFRELEALGAPLEREHLLAGAGAARALGDVAAARERLQAAARIEGSRDVVEQLWTIDHEYGRVELVVPGGMAVELVLDPAPLLPDKRAAVAFARERLRAEGRFTGYLPVGGYRLDGQAFTVEASADPLRVVVEGE